MAEQIGSQLGGYQTERSRYRRMKRDSRGAARRTRRDAWPTRSSQEHALGKDRTESARKLLLNAYEPQKHTKRS